MIALAIVGAVLLAIFAGLVIVGIVEERPSVRAEKARIERERLRAEYQLHELANEAFTALLDAARAHSEDFREQ